MGLIARVLASFTLNYPTSNSKCTLEDNPGDNWPIHLHLAHGQPGSMRVHFTYDEFKELAGALIKERDEYGSKIPEINVEQ